MNLPINSNKNINFHQQLESLANASQSKHLMVAGEGELILVGIVRFVFETIKGWLGFYNRTGAAPVEYEFIRFLGKNALKGAILPQDLQLIEKIATKIGLIHGNETSEKNHAELNSLVQLIAKQILKNQIITASLFQESETSFYDSHKNSLKFIAPSLPIHAPTQIFQQVIESPKVNQEASREVQKEVLEKPLKNKVEIVDIKSSKEIEKPASNKSKIIKGLALGALLGLPALIGLASTLYKPATPPPPPQPDLPNPQSDVNASQSQPLPAQNHSNIPQEVCPILPFEPSLNITPEIPSPPIPSPQPSNALTVVTLPSTPISEIPPTPPVTPSAINRPLPLPIGKPRTLEIYNAPAIPKAPPFRPILALPPAPPKPTILEFSDEFIKPLNEESESPVSPIIEMPQPLIASSQPSEEVAVNISNNAMCEPEQIFDAYRPLQSYSWHPLPISLTNTSAAPKSKEDTPLSESDEAHQVNNSNGNKDSSPQLPEKSNENSYLGILGGAALAALSAIGLIRARKEKAQAQVPSAPSSSSLSSAAAASTSSSAPAPTANNLRKQRRNASANTYLGKLGLPPLSIDNENFKKLSKLLYDEEEDHPTPEPQSTPPQALTPPAPTLASSPLSSPTSTASSSPTTHVPPSSPPSLALSIDPSRSPSPIQGEPSPDTLNHKANVLAIINFGTDANEQIKSFGPRQLAKANGLNWLYGFFAGTSLDETVKVVDATLQKAKKDYDSAFQKVDRGLTRDGKQISRDTAEAIREYVEHYLIINNLTSAMHRILSVYVNRYPKKDHPGVADLENSCNTWMNQLLEVDGQYNKIATTLGIRTTRDNISHERAASNLEAYCANYCTGNVAKPLLATGLINEGKNLVHDIISGKKTSVDPTNANHEMAALQWYLMDAAIKKNQGFEEGAFVIDEGNDHRLYNYLLTHPQQKDRASSHFVGRSEVYKSPFHIIFESALHKGIDVFDGSLPAKKRTIDFALVDAFGQPGKKLLFIKPENYSPFLELDTEHPYDFAMHALEFVESQKRKKAGAGGDDQPGMQKERVPDNTKKAFQAILDCIKKYENIQQNEVEEVQSIARAFVESIPGLGRAVKAANAASSAVSSAASAVSNIFVKSDLEKALDQASKDAKKWGIAAMKAFLSTENLKKLKLKCFKNEAFVKEYTQLMETYKATRVGLDNLEQRTGREVFLTASDLGIPPAPLQASSSSSSSSSTLVQDASNLLQSPSPSRPIARLIDPLEGKQEKQS